MATPVQISPATPDVCTPADVKTDEFDLTSGHMTLRQVKPGLGGFSGAPFLSSETERLKALAGCLPSDMSQEPHFSQIAALISKVFNVPMSLVDVVSSDAVWVKGGVGLGQQVPTDRRWSFCTWILLPLKPEALVVEDLSKDARFADHSMVAGPPHVRFYAAAPLVTSTGFRLGTVCGVDYRPRKLPAEAVKWLCNIAELIVQDIERTLKAPMGGARMFRQLRSTYQPVLLLDMQEPGWKILYGTCLWPTDTAAAEGNTIIAPAAGNASEDALCPITDKCFWDVYNPMTPIRNADWPVWQQYSGSVRKGHSFQLVVRSKQDSTQMLCLDLRPGGLAKVLDDAVEISVSSMEPTSTDTVDVRRLYFAVLLNNELAHAHSVRSTDSACTGLDSSAGETSADATLTTGGNATNTTAMRQSSGSQGSGRDQSAAASWQPTPFPDVYMGPLLGQGAYGKVYIGTMHKASVAIKVIPSMLHPRRVEGPTQDTPPLTSGTEGAVGLKLQHPNVIRTHMWKVSSQSDDEQTSKRRRLADVSFGQAGAPGVKDHTWIVLEYCDKGTLQTAIDKGLFRTGRSSWLGGPDMVAVLNMALQIAEGMEYLHEQGVLHGDLSPKNVLLQQNDSRQRPPFTAKVCDFGLSREYDHAQASIATHTYGTVTHMPTELVTQGRLTRSSDVYAFGVILWELYTGQRPFAGYNAVQLVAQRILNKVQLAFEVPTPTPYSELAERCMAENVEERPTFTEIVAELKRMQQLLQEGALDAGEFPVWGDPLPQQQDVSKQLTMCGVCRGTEAKGIDD